MKDCRYSDFLKKNTGN